VAGIGTQAKEVEKATPEGHEGIIVEQVFGVNEGEEERRVTERRKYAAG
jgi:hypothetical protein